MWAGLEELRHLDANEHGKLLLPKGPKEQGKEKVSGSLVTTRATRRGCLTKAMVVEGHRNRD